MIVILCGKRDFAYTLKVPNQLNLHSSKGRLSQRCWPNRVSPWKRSNSRCSPVGMKKQTVMLWRGPRGQVLRAVSRNWEWSPANTSKKIGTSVLQPQETRFCQQLVCLGITLSFWTDVLMARRSLSRNWAISLDESPAAAPWHCSSSEPNLTFFYNALNLTSWSLL